MKSLGLKYIKLSFPNKNQILYENNNRPESDRQSLGAVSHVNSAYIRHSNVNDFFSGGMDSANTEATLISRNSRPGGKLISNSQSIIFFSNHFLQR